MTGAELYRLRILADADAAYLQRIRGERAAAQQATPRPRWPAGADSRSPR